MNWAAGALPLDLLEQKMTRWTSAQVTANWRYLGRELFSDAEFALFATVCFSTVIPAVFTNAPIDPWVSLAAATTTRSANTTGASSSPTTAAAAGNLLAHSGVQSIQAGSSAGS